MRWLGVDPGTVRVGVAICDSEEHLAVPLEIVPAAAAIPALRAIARRDGVEGVVIGLPISLDGVERASAAAARKFGERVRRVLGLPVEYEDERWTTVAAEQNQPPGRRSDDMAATLLLQQFIDRRRRDAEPAE